MREYYSTLLRTFALFTPANVETIVANVTVPGTPSPASPGGTQTVPQVNLGLFQAAAVRLFFLEICRLYVPRPAAATSAAASGGPASSAGPAPTSGPPARPLVKHALYISQLDEREIVHITESDRNDLIRRYQKHFGAGLWPHPDDEPQAE